MKRNEFVVDKASLVTTAKQLLKKAKKFSDVNNWLYQHPKFLRGYGVINGESAAGELKQVAKHQIDVSHYAGAMATLRKLNDLRPNAFYDFNSYELVSLAELKHRVFHPQAD